jgi:hypothetical protein
MIFGKDTPPGHCETPFSTAMAAGQSIVVMNAAMAGAASTNARIVASLVLERSPPSRAGSPSCSIPIQEFP